MNASIEPALLPFLTIYIVLLNLAAFILCGQDKRLAKEGGYRIPEIILFLVTILGGSIGMLLGMELFRHKTRKARFQIIVALAVALHVYLIRHFHLISLLKQI